MNKTQTNSGNNLCTRQDKDTKNQTQASRFYHLLNDKALTCTQASEILGEPQKSLCRTKRRLEKAGMLWVAGLVRCPVTNYYAQRLTTNPDLVPMSNQLKLFTYGID